MVFILIQNVLRIFITQNTIYEHRKHDYSVDQSLLRIMKILARI